jgi:hypothetical protein
MQKVQAKIRPRQRIQAKSLSAGGIISITQIREIDESNKTNGSILRYDENTNKFKATKSIDLNE